MVDSVRGLYNIDSIKSFDSTAVDKLYEKGYVLFSSYFVFMEQTDSSAYTAIYSRSPRDFEKVNKEYAHLAKAYNFISHDVLDRNGEVEKWIEKKVIFDD